MDTSSPIDLATLAGHANLTYVSEGHPGYQRRKRGRGFVLVDGQGKPIKNERLRTRVERLRIPPAWSQVWVCMDDCGHIQATGRDAKGRKQYIYHPQWASVRDQVKFERLLQFADALPDLRRQVQQDRQRRTLDWEKVAAIVVTLLDKTSIRIGNQEYLRQNESYGLTTLQDQHVEIEGSQVTFTFRGKRGVEHIIEIHDKRLARLIKQCQDLPGQELFQYRDDAGVWHSLRSNDVNNYLRTISGQNFTAKDFRTWGGTITAATYLAAQDPAQSSSERTKKIRCAVKEAAQLLGNTITVCRQYYIHPAVLNAYLDGSLFTVLEEAKSSPDNAALLSVEEIGVRNLLRG